MVFCLRKQCSLRRSVLMTVMSCIAILIAGKVIYQYRPSDNIDLQVSARPFVSPPAKKFDVILSAYMNSGSRFTGRLMGFREDSFYFYEPLWRFSTWDFYKSPNTVCSSTFGNCRETNPTETNMYQPYPDSQQEQIMYNISSIKTTGSLLNEALAGIFRCDLLTLKNLVVMRVQDHQQYSGPSWEGFRRCTDRLVGKSACLKELENGCFNAHHRVTKVIRLTLGSFRPLLEANKNLKIVHLFRDPRALVNSRLQSRGYPLPFVRTNTSLEENLCQKMMWDFREGLYLMQIYPERVKFVFYEDIMSNLHSFSKELYRFLGMAHNVSLVDQLSRVKTNLALPEMPDISRDRDRRKNNAFWWRTYMSWREVTQVDKICEEVYTQMGYRRLSTEEELRNLSIPTFIKASQFSL